MDENINIDNINNNNIDNMQSFSYFIKNILNYIPYEKIEVAKALFKKMSKDGGQTVLSSNLGTMLRLLELNPSNIEIQEILNSLKLNENEIKESLTFEELLVCIARKRRESDTFDELLSSFRMLDKNATGLIPEHTVRYYLQHYADSFSDEEMDAFFKEANTYFMTEINEVKYLNYSDFALHLKGLYTPPEPVKQGKDKKKK